MVLTIRGQVKPTTRMTQFEIGSASQPSIAFANAQSTGLYLADPATGTMGLASNGQAVVLIGNGGVTTDTITSNLLTANLVDSGTVQAGTLDVWGNARVHGNLIVESGNVVTIESQVYVSDQVVANNAGTGPALVINQSGVEPLVDIQDDGVTVAKWYDGGSLALAANTSNALDTFVPNGNLLTVHGNVSADMVTANTLSGNLAWSNLQGYPHVAVGDGLSGGGELSANVTVSHADTSSQANVDNLGGNVIQSVGVDGFGHVANVQSTDLDQRYVNLTGDTMTGALTATSFSGNGAALTDLNASEITSGTVDVARLPHASTSAQGVVQLSDSTSTTDSTLAATASAVKSAYDLAAGKVSKSGDTMTGVLTVQSQVNVSGENRGFSVYDTRWGFMKYSGHNACLARTTDANGFGIVRLGGADITTPNNGVTYDMFFNSSGNVGIGTTYPAYTLDVAGTLRATGSITADSDLFFSQSLGQKINLYGTSDTRWGFGIQGDTVYSRTGNHFAWFQGGVHSDTPFDAGSGGTTMMVLTSDGRLGVGTTSPARSLHVEGSIGIQMGSSSVATDTTSGIFWSHDTSYGIHRTGGSWTNPDYQQLKIHWPTGIILAPTETNGGTYGKSYVDVQGSLRATGSITADSDITLNGSTSKLVVMNGQDGGNKGIAMWTASDTNWAIYMGPGGDLVQSFAGDTDYAATGNGFWGHAIRFRVPDNSNQGFIFENHTEQLLMSLRGSDGYMWVAGAVSVYTLTNRSDDRLKYGERFIEDATSTIMKLRPQTYSKTASIDAEPSENDPLESGLIAQEVWYAAPELRHLVKVPDDAEPAEVIESSTDPTQDPDYSSWGTDAAALNYTGLIPYLIKTCQEQQSLIANHQALIEAQAATIASLGARVSALEAQK